MSAVVWTPSPEAVAASQLTDFRRHCEAATGQRFADHAAFHAFSTREFRTFWRLFVAWSGVAVEGSVEPVCVGDACETAVFFPALRVSYVENLLRARAPDALDRTAVSAYDERGGVARLTRRALTERVLAVAAGLRALGVVAGDRVVAVARNTVESVVACLGAAALGATWASAAPDLSLDAVRERFAQLAPTVLFLHATATHHGVTRSLVEGVPALREALPSLRHVVALDAARFDGADTTLDALAAAHRGALSLDALPRLPWNHPLFVVFSSGTTGAPKCIVHGAGGTLVEHLKEHLLHGDLRARDRLLFLTTCGWMMWNWQLSALAAGAEIALYDGSPTYPDEDSLWRLVDAAGVTVFGLSPTFLQYTFAAGIVPRERFSLTALRAILSTGSVLGDALFDRVRDDVGPLPLQSISGGTDILGCFLLGNPDLPVHRGELQCASLAMDVRVADAGPDGIGELVCAGPFPSRPLGLLDDPTGRRFHDAYFSQHAGVWTHGDLLELTATGARLHGRSDGIINVRGVRVGPAEIYSALATFTDLIAAMAVEQRAPDEPGGTRLVLLVVLRAGVTLDRPLTLRMKRELSQRRSMAHVPAVIAQVDALPTTLNGKLSERAARDALDGRVVANRAALRNPECLDALAQHPALRSTR
jgi:acetoacetyl-CoA synthetase